MRIGCTVALLVLALCARAVSACGPQPSATYQSVESGRFTVWIRSTPLKPAVGSDFVLDVFVCGKGTANPGGIVTDAWMPAHRHGMNSRPSVKLLGPGHWRAEGFVFHMPGRWQYTIDVDTPAGRDRLTRDVVIE